ncbi:MAG TPA: hypothetical protein VKS25_00985 [Solirubrobacteraceae bacterium]|nr:hypothetical protein [Solirubrobacteraceae bacterium]
MNPLFNLALAEARQTELRDAALAARRARRVIGRRHRPPSGPSTFWQGMTVRLATSADRAALSRLADLEEAAQPSEPVLLGELMQRPVAALSLCDGRVVADPFVPTSELVELLRLRARQMARQ